MNMIRKGQVQGVAKGDIRRQVALVAKLFGLVASERLKGPLTLNFFSSYFLQHNPRTWLWQALPEETEVRWGPGAWLDSLQRFATAHTS